MRFSKKKLFPKEIKAYLRASILRTRAASGITQGEMAHRLLLSTRAYAKLEAGACCSLVTALIFLSRGCPDRCQLRCIPPSLQPALRCAQDSNSSFRSRGTDTSTFPKAGTQRFSAVPVTAVVRVLVLIGRACYSPVRHQARPPDHSP